MVTGIIGKKVGMTQLFDADGSVHPATVLKAGPCVVAQVKTVESDGYEAVQLGFVDARATKENKPTQGHFKKAGVPATRITREVTLKAGGDPVKAGDQIKVGVRRIHALLHPGLSFLILTDGSASSEVTLALGGQIARLAHAQVTILTYGSNGDAPNHLQEMKEKLGSGLAQLEVRVTTDPADMAVAKEVERQPYDLVVMDSGDRGTVRFVPDDGVGRTVRNGLNFTERGFGVRAAVGCSDRGHTAASQMRPGEVDWDVLFGRDGARWFHTGGIFAALSETTPLVAKEAMAAAKKHGTVVSYDLNYRPSLWKSIGGQKRAQEVNRDLARHVDVMLGNEEDFTAALGFEVEGLDENLSALDPANFRRMIERAVASFPNFQVVATTLRHARTASLNDWAAVVFTGGQLHRSRAYDGLEIWDRVGGGDSFASGLIYGFLTGRGPQWAVECGAAHGALAMTTPGDTSMATLAEVEKAMRGLGTRVER